MAIPRHNDIYKDILEICSNGETYTYKDIERILSERLKLTSQEVNQLLESGVRTILMDRIGWSITYMVKAGLMERPHRGYFKITKEGKKLLSSKPERIDTDTLEQYPSFIEFQKRKNEKVETTNSTPTSTPRDVLESGYKSIYENLKTELLDQIKSCSPQFFEKLVVDLLIRMGYGGSRKDAGEAIGKSGDEGIDGVINEDKLGLDTIYIQAKRWQGTVGRPEIQKFVGALHGKHAHKGIFITTSSYSPDAISYASSVESKIILIDGSRLADLMIESNVGISPESVYEVKRIDSDYFIES